jgi:hypothetical protein
MHNKGQVPAQYIRFFRESSTCDVGRKFKKCPVTYINDISTTVVVGLTGNLP